MFKSHNITDYYCRNVTQGCGIEEEDLEELKLEEIQEQPITMTQ